MSVTAFSPAAAGRELTRMRDLRPLVHCLTNDVVQEITADVLLAAGASPAMVVAPEEASTFTAISGAVLINTGTPTADMMRSMRESAAAANEHGVPWVLDPVAAGVIKWRDGEIYSLLALGPTVVRGNASEIRALAGIGTGGKGVDSLDSSESAIEAAKALAVQSGAVVCVTGETDFVTDGERTVSVTGGNAMATLVVGTGCSLSALVAAFLAGAPDRVDAVAAACSLAKLAAHRAGLTARAPGSFHMAYIDALYLIEEKDFA